ncbi:MAG: MFS transporter [Opitutaceae bacterium]|jgi:ACS family hexuronate transporter-like MFS transporter|nr:MFS transporter [Opitutaceae bacterium]
MTTPQNTPQSAPQNAAPQNTAPARAGGNFRWVICTLLFFSVALNYIDRNIIGILKMPLSEKLGWSENDFGTIAAGFSFAYAFGYLIGGRLIQRFGVRYGLPGFVFFWSLAAMAHGLCGLIPAEARMSIGYPWLNFDTGFFIATLALPSTAFGFLMARIALGLTEGGNFPGAIKAVAEWFPQKERALATGLFNAGTNVGAVICPVAVPMLLKQVGWESTFYITGALGFAWLVAWWFLYESPDRSKRVKASELAYIRDGKAAETPAEKKESMPWRNILRYRAVWAYIIAGILAGPVWTVYQFFLPDFIYKRYNELHAQLGDWSKVFYFTTPATATDELLNQGRLFESGVWTGVFYFLAAIGGVFFGWLAGKLLNRGWTINAARKIALLICALSVVPIYFAPFASHVWLAVLIVGIAGSAHQGWSANLFSFVSDTMPRKAISSVVGLGGFVTYFTGGVVSKATGWILQTTGSYVYVFAWASSMYVLSLIAIHLLVPRIPQSPDNA